jgi:hypothetical protein
MGEFSSVDVQQAARLSGIFKFSERQQASRLSYILKQAMTGGKAHNFPPRPRFSKSAQMLH